VTRNPEPVDPEPEEQEKERPGSATPAPDAPLRPDVAAIMTRLSDLVVANGSKKPSSGKAAQDAARLILDTDRRPLDEVLKIIEWSQNSIFWRANVRSVEKLRKQYDTLRLQMEANPNGRSGHKPYQDTHNLDEYGESL
jgi:hypothetical protein